VASVLFSEWALAAPSVAVYAVPGSYFGYPESFIWDGQTLNVVPNSGQAVQFSFNDTTAEQNGANVTVTLQNTQCGGPSIYNCAYFMSLITLSHGVYVNPTAPSGAYCGLGTGPCNGLFATWIQITGSVPSLRATLEAGVTFSQTNTPAITRATRSQQFTLSATSGDGTASLSFNVDIGPSPSQASGYDFSLQVSHFTNWSSWLPIQFEIVCAAGFSNSQIFTTAPPFLYFFFIANSVGDQPAAQASATAFQAALQAATGVNYTGPLQPYQKYIGTVGSVVQLGGGGWIYNCGGYNSLLWNQCDFTPFSCDAVRNSVSTVLMAILLGVVMYAF